MYKVCENLTLSALWSFEKSVTTAIICFMKDASQKMEWQIPFIFKPSGFIVCRKTNWLLLHSMQWLVITDFDNRTLSLLICLECRLFYVFPICISQMGKPRLRKVKWLRQVAHVLNHRAWPWAFHPVWDPDQAFSILLLSYSRIQLTFIQYVFSNSTNMYRVPTTCWIYASIENTPVNKVDIVPDFL